jgi:nucleotide-binding universal stress UspA family protein
MHRVLVGANGSEAGQDAALVAERLAHRVRAIYRTMNVVTSGLPGYPEASRGTGLSPQSTSARGIPGIEIARAAGDWPADLVVIGRRALAAQETLGVTIEALLRRLTRPCLLIPPGVDEIHRMLVALDGTVRGLGILPTAAALAQALDLSASAVYVTPDPLSTSTAEQRLREALQKFPVLGPVAVASHTGSPVEAILERASTAGADLLVVGVRRGGPPGEAGSGHVGKDLLRRAPTAILTVPI